MSEPDPRVLCSVTGMFDTAWRTAYLDQLRRLLTGRRDESELLPLTDAVAALGHRGETVVGLREVPVSSIVGTVSRAGDFDREFRPLNRCLRDRWEGLARVDGELPPVELVQLGDLYFVEDGHHRVSVARARGARTVRARVRRIRTMACANHCLTVADLPAKTRERMFLERVPLPEDARVGLRLDEPSDYERLAESAEAWGFRQTIDGRAIGDRCQLADAWWAEEVVPVVEQLRSRGVCASGADLAAYLRALDGCRIDHSDSDGGDLDGGDLDGRGSEGGATGARGGPRR